MKTETFVKAEAFLNFVASPFVRYTEVDVINYQTSGDKLAKKLAKEDLSFIAFLNIEASTLRPISRSKWNKLPDYGGQVSEVVSEEGSSS